MAKPKQPSSPTLQLALLAEQYERAKASDSGACLIADAIKEQYPELSNVQVDMATIRVTDRAKGVRYIYLTPPSAQHVLLAFDQGWPNPADHLVIRRAVQIAKIKRSGRGRNSLAEVKQQREQRKAELQQKLALGEDLTRDEKGALTRLSKPYQPVERPASHGPVEAVETHNVKEPVTVIGGRPLPKGVPHPNLLRYRNRHYGAKLADPGVAFREAVEEAVAQRLAEQQPV